MSKDKKCCKNKYTSIGGQALIEGIMMRGPERSVMAVRLPDGTVGIEDVEFNSITKRNKFFALPVIRGAVALVESLLNGYKALMRSADLSGMMDLEEEQKSKPTPAEAEVEGENFAEPAPESEAEIPEGQPEEVAKEADEQSEEESEAQSETVTHVIRPDIEVLDESIEDAPNGAKTKKENMMSTIIGVVAMVLGVGLAAVLFFVLPTLAFNLINRLDGVDITPYRALFEGGIKILIFVGYMFAVSFMKDIKRVFMYHGAEHKTIFCFEKGLELTVENVRAQRRFHPRCGTSFMIVMLIVSVLISFLLLTFVPGVQMLAENFGLLWAIIRILMMPLICGLGYEVIRFCGKHDNIFTRIVSAPGVWLQHISTKEPDDSMIEVAIESLKAVIPQKEEQVEAE